MVTIAFTYQNKMASSSYFARFGEVYDVTTFKHLSPGTHDGSVPLLQLSLDLV